MSNQELKQFIYKASRATYASGDESIKQKEKDGSTSIYFSEGEYGFHDNYFGGEPYGGREVVFFKDNPVWMMVYYGLVYNDDTSVVYGFFMKALSNSTLEVPYRGPVAYQEGEWLYENKFSGNLEKLSGIEKIYKNSICIYEASYVGGVVNR